MGALKVWDGTSWQYASAGDPPALPHVYLTNPQRQAGADSNFPTADTPIRWVTTATLDSTGALTIGSQAVGALGGILINVDGLYDIDCKFTFASNTTGNIRTLAVLNSGGGIVGFDQAMPSGAGGSSLTIRTALRMSAGDSVRATANHNTTPATVLSVYGISAGICHFAVTKLSD